MRTVARHEHPKPLRIVHALYPEGDAFAHNLPVHPPWGPVAVTPSMSPCASQEAGTA